jgi:hypothetical protein
MRTTQKRRMKINPTVETNHRRVELLVDPIKPSKAEVALGRVLDKEFSSRLMALREQRLRMLNNKSLKI